MPLPTVVVQHPFWHLCGVAMFAVFFFIHRQAKKSGAFCMVLWNLTGVILHETAHLLVGLLLRAEPTGFSVIPRREGNRWRLGSVSFRRVNSLNAVPVALAPLGLVAVAYWFSLNWFRWYAPTFPLTLALYAVVFILTYNALPSSQDLRVACRWTSVLLYTSVAAAFAWYQWPFVRQLVSAHLFR